MCRITDIMAGLVFGEPSSNGLVANLKTGLKNGVISLKSFSNQLKYWIGASVNKLTVICLSWL